MGILGIDLDSLAQQRRRGSIVSDDGSAMESRQPLKIHLKVKEVNGEASRLKVDPCLNKRIDHVGFAFFPGPVDRRVSHVINVFQARAELEQAKGRAFSERTIASWGLRLPSNESIPRRHGCFPLLCGAVVVLRC